MKNLFISSIIFFVLTNCSIGQNKKLLKDFLMADSVMVVSHLLTYNPVSNNTQKQFKLLLNDKPDYSIIKQQYKLNNKDRDSLLNILITPNNDSIVEKIMCFNPHHGIIISKNKKYTFFDICFGCHHFISSKKYKISDVLSEQTWKKLELFFRNRNLNYGMPENDDD